MVNDYKKHIKYLLLVIIAVFLSSYSYVIGFGITINIGSILGILILLIYGKRKGILAGIIVFICGLMINGAKISEVVYIGELYLIDYIITKKKKDTYIIVDIIYWIILSLIGFSIIGIIYNLNTNKDYYFFQITFIIINNIVNALISEILYRYIIKGIIHKEKIKIDLKELILHIILVAILLPSILNIFDDIVKTSEDTSEMVETSAMEVYDNVKEAISYLTIYERQKLNLEDVVEVKKLTRNILVHSKYKKFNIKLLNSSEKAVVEVNNATRKMEKQKEYNAIKKHSKYLTKVVPVSNYPSFMGANWIDGFFVYERDVDDTYLSIFIEIPIEIYKTRIYLEFISQLKFLVIFGFIGIILAITLNRVIFEDLKILSKRTSKYKELLNITDFNNWPNSKIAEVNGLIENVKGIVKELILSYRELKNSEEQLYQLAYYDTLTTLPNRLLFILDLETFSNNLEENEKIGIIFMDLNRFKVINDTLGHESGDRLLFEVAKRLLILKDSKLNIYRLGGDEFVFVAKVFDRDDIREIGNKIINILSENFIIDDVLLDINCSIGASLYPDDSRNINNIIKYADIAMYKSKDLDGTRIKLFNKEMKEFIYQKLVIEKEIFNALENDEFKLYYQPKYYSKNGEVASIEALIRWSSNKLGVVPPDKFISIAEESDLILKIDKWVMLKACKDNKKLQEGGFKKAPVSVNISAKHFRGDEIEKLVKACLEESKLEAKYLIIEITEGILINNFEGVEKIIRNLNQMGISVSIDDFGKGYSSFNQLMKLPINEIKIDKVFIRGIQSDVKKKNIVKSMVDLAHGLKLNIVAEGIEYSEEKEYLSEIGCDELQGYLFTRPIPIEELKGKLKEVLENKNL